MRPQRCYNRRAMTEQRGSALATILFTDLVNSTQLMQRAGDEMRSAFSRRITSCYVTL